MRTLKLLVILSIFFSCMSSLFAQVDTAFWFVAPELTEEHVQDWPIIFRISGLDEEAHVTISQPANSGFTPITRTVGANELLSVNMTDYKSDVENLPINTVNNKGFLITSDVPITVYYELANEWNPDKFVLKGSNALGTDFYTVGQHDFANHTKDGYKKAYERIDIVATEDDTEITITPAEECVGHPAGTPFTITLDRGQTYSIQALSQKANRTLAGTHISSNKDIAVTVSDDSLDLTFGGGRDGSTSLHWDLIGDQLIPTSVLGTEYVAVRTFFDDRDNGNGVSNVQKVYIVATEDNTDIYFDGNSNKITRLDHGELLEVNIQDIAMLINSSKPVYVYQVTAIHGELGSAILPPAHCTGSRSVSFVRNFADGFWIQLATKSNNTDDFILTDNNGNSTSLTSLINWGVVPGTDNGVASETWYAATIDLSGAVSTGTQYTVSNSSGLFHMGIVDQVNSSLNFGYFSSYSSLKIDGLSQQCYGNVIQLDVSNGTSSTDLSWYSSITGSTVLSTSSTLDVSETATYWVEVNMKDDGCVMVDSIDVEFNMPEFDLGPADTALCVNENISFEAPSGYPGYLWDNNSVTTSRSVTITSNMSQEVWLEVTDESGCTGWDTILITNLPEAELEIELTGNQSICLGDTIFDTANMAHYEWQIVGASFDPQDTLSYYVPTQAGIFDILVNAWNAEGCSTSETITVTVNAPISIDLTDVSECSNVAHTYSLPAGMQSYEWSNGSTSNSATYNMPGDVWVNVIDVNGCIASDSANINWNAVADVPSRLISECPYSDLSLNANTILVNNYNWSFDNGIDPVINLNQSTNTFNLTNISESNEGLYIIKGVDANGCAAVDTIDLIVEEIPAFSLGLDQTICSDDSVSLGHDNVYLKDYQWSTPTDANYSTVSTIMVNTSNTYFLQATTISNYCPVYDTVNVTVNPVPSVLLPDIMDCKGATYTFNAGSHASYEWSTGSSNSQITVSWPSNVWVEVTDVNGCTARDEGSLGWYQESYVSAGDTGVCAGDDITLEVSDLNLATIEWSFNTLSNVIATSTSTYSVSAAVAGDQGIYYVRGVDGNGCNVIDRINLTVGTIPSLSLGAASVDMCIGDSIKVDASQGFKTYDWTIGADPTIISAPYLIVTSSMGGETVYLDATHSNGCSATTSVDILSADPQPVIDLGGYYQECPENLEIKLDSTFNYTSNSANSEPSVIKWFSVDNDIEIPNSLVSDPGRYSVYVENDNGCFNWDIIDVDFRVAEEVDLTDEEVCDGESINLSAPGGYSNLANYNYQWAYRDVNNVVSAGPSNNSFDVSNEGYYVLEITNLSTTCVVKDSMYLTNKPVSNLNLGADTEVCRGDSIQLTADQGMYHYEWSRSSDPATIISTDYSIVVNEADDYYLEITNRNECTSGDTINVAINELPIVQLASLNPVCIDSSTVISISSVTENDGVTPIIPQSISWSTGMGTNQSSITVANTGGYSVEIVDSNGCKDQDSLIITNYSRTNIGLPESRDVCDQSTIELTLPMAIAGNVQSYRWFKGSVGSAEQGAADSPWNVSDVGNYILTITDNNGCGNRDTLEVEVLDIPAFDLGQDTTICQFDTLYITPQSNFASYEWNGQVSENNPYFVVENSQMHVLEIVHTNGCSARDSIMVTARQAPTVDLGDDIWVCSYTDTIIDAGPGYAYLWSTGETTQIISASRGSYNVTLTDGIGCANSDSIAIRFYEVPDVYIGSDTSICDGDDLLLDAGSGFNSYEWHDGTTNQSTYAYLNALSEVYVTDANGCYGWDARMVWLIPIPEINLGPDTTICETDSILLNAGADFLDYLWSDNSVDTSMYAGNEGQHWVSAYDGCLWVQDTIEIVHHESPVVAGVDTMVYARVTLTAESGTPPYQYQLEDGPYQNSNSFTGLEEGTHVFTVIDYNGCYALDTVSLSLELEDIVIPNFFTPNNDGYNDNWTIEGIDDRFPDSRVDIYDRYGKLLYSFHALDFKWDGKYYNKQMPSDDYWYVLFLNADDITYKVFKGHFTLKR